MISHVDGAGVRLAVREWGEAPPSIVALHPGVGDLRSWVTCAELWARAGHHVVAYDRRGFGETRCDPGPHRDTDDLDLILRHRTEGPVTLVGTSRGGGLALDFALGVGTVLADADEVGRPRRVLERRDGAGVDR